MKLSKTITYEKAVYVLSTITYGNSKGVSFSQDDGTQLPSKEFNMRLIRASVMAGGTSAAEAAELTDGFPVFDSKGFETFFSAAMEVNGLKLEGKKSGEDEAGVSAPAESTIDSSQPA